VLTIFRAAGTTNDEAALALDRWKALELTEQEGAGAGERRFRRRAYERARDRALTVAAMDLAAELPSGQPTARRRRSRRARAARAAGGRRGRSWPARAVKA
jgi:hypothetical protein